MPPAGGRVKGGILFRKREYPLWNPKRKAFIASEQLEELQCLPIALPARGVAAFGVAIGFAAASIIRCRSAHLVGVRSNFRLPPVPSMRRAQQCRYFARSLPPMRTSLAPHDSKARLRTASTRRSFMAKPCTPHPHCAACAVIRATNWQCRGSRGPPRPFSWGCKGDILFREREYPPFPRPPHGVGDNRVRPAGAKKKHPFGCSLFIQQ